MSIRKLATHAAAAGALALNALGTYTLFNWVSRVWDRLDSLGFWVGGGC